MVSIGKDITAAQNLGTATYSTGGAEGVGKATTTSVVYSFMIILITDYLLVSILGMFGM